MLRFVIVLSALSISVIAIAEPSPSQSQTAGTTSPGVVESQSVVFDYGNYDPYDRANLYGFNHAPSVTRVGPSRLQAAWFSGPYEASIHQVILGAVSEDGGATWQDAKVLNDAPRLSDFDPAFIDAGDRTLLFFSTGRWTRWPFVGYRDAERTQVGGKSFTIHMKQQLGDQDVWSDTIDLGTEPGWNCRSNGLRLATGELLLPTHRLDPLPYVSSVWISGDDGKTWERGSEVSIPGNSGAAEPSIAQLSDGSLVMSLRANDGRVWLARSSDRGRTWSAAERTDLVAAASSSNVFCTSSGRLVLTYNSSSPERTELALRVSDDGGATWSDASVLAKAEPSAESEEVYSRQVCYPSVCELEDGALRVVWADIEVSSKLQSGIIKSALVRLHGENQD